MSDRCDCLPFVHPDGVMHDNECPVRQQNDRTLADAITGAMAEKLSEDCPDYWPQLDLWADAILALPEIATLLADAERVQRVRELAEEWDEYPASPEAARARELYRALDGDL